MPVSAPEIFHGVFLDHLARGKLHVSGCWSPHDMGRIAASGEEERAKLQRMGQTFFELVLATIVVKRFPLCLRSKHAQTEIREAFLVDGFSAMASRQLYQEGTPPPMPHAQLFYATLGVIFGAADIQTRGIPNGQSMRESSGWTERMLEPTIHTLVEYFAGMPPPARTPRIYEEDTLLDELMYPRKWTAQSIQRVEAQYPESGSNRRLDEKENMASSSGPVLKKPRANPDSLQTIDRKQTGSL